MNHKLVNPFITEKKLAVKEIRRGYTKTIENTDIEMNRIESGKRIVYLDNEEFVKIFHPFIKIIPELKTVELKLITKIIDDMTLSVERFLDFDQERQHYASDYIMLNANDFAKLEDISIRTIERSIKELITLNILARGNVPHRYWVNPYMIFIGDRAKRYKKYITVINDTFELEYNRNK